MRLRLQMPRREWQLSVKHTSISTIKDGMLHSLIYDLVVSA